MAAEGCEADMADVVDVLARQAARRWAPDGIVDRRTWTGPGARRSGRSPAVSGDTRAGRTTADPVRQAGGRPDGGLALPREAGLAAGPARMGQDSWA